MSVAGSLPRALLDDAAHHGRAGAARQLAELLHGGFGADAGLPAGGDADQEGVLAAAGVVGSLRVMCVGALPLSLSGF